MRKIIAVIFILILLVVPFAHGNGVSIQSTMKDRYHCSITITQYFGENIKKQYDIDSSGYLNENEVYLMLKNQGIKLNLTPVIQNYYELGNLTLDGRVPFFNIHQLNYTYQLPMPVNGTSKIIMIFNFVFYLNGTSDHVFKLSLPGVKGFFSLTLPKNDTFLNTNLINPKINGHEISGEFKNSIIIHFREMNYFWMNIYANAAVILGVVLFIFAAYKFRGGKTRGIKLLIRSILRNLVSLFIVLTFLFYILWVAGPPLSVRVGGIANILMRLHIIQYYHLDRPWYDQYLNWWHLLLTGNITKGVTWGLQGLSLEKALLVSLTIFILTAVFSYLISIYIAVRKKSSRSIDLYAALFLALYSIPTFYATYLILNLFENYPTIYSILVAPQGGFQEMIQILAAVLILSLLTLARPYLIARALAVKEYREPYINTFKAIGLTPRKIKRYVRRGTTIPTITDSVLNFGWILTAQVFLEVMFKIHGMGYILFNGTVNGNPFQIQIAIIYFSLVMITASTFSDIIIFYLDPRVRR